MPSLLHEKNKITPLSTPDAFFVSDSEPELLPDLAEPGGLFFFCHGGDFALRLLLLVEKK